MESATPFAYRRPVATRRPGRRLARLLRTAGVMLAGVLLAVPVVTLPEGEPARVADIRPLRAGPAGKLAPLPGSEGLDPAAAFASGPAQPFAARYGDAQSALRAETCLTEAIYYEAAHEPEAGQRAVAQVVLNRVRHPAYPDTVCGVVFQGQERSTGCQFTFTCDGSRARAPDPALWRRANRVARAALGGAVAAEVGLATHYHADYVQPYWSAALAPAGQIGRHLFYRWRSGAGEPAAFTARYAGREPLIAAWTPRPAAMPDVITEAAATLASAAPAMPAPAPARLAIKGTPLIRAEAASAAEAPPPAAAPAPAPLKMRPLLLAAKADKADKAEP